MPVFLTKDRIFCGVPQKIPSSSWVLISGVKRKEAYMSQVKTKTKNKPKGGENHD